MQKETRFKMKVQSKLAGLPTLWIVKIQQVALRGIPDILMCANGTFVAWELKVGNNKVTDLQQHILNKITKANGVARIVTPENLDDMMEELQCLLNS